MLTHKVTPQSKIFYVAKILLELQNNNYKIITKNNYKTVVGAPSSV